MPVVYADGCSAREGEVKDDLAIRRIRFHLLRWRFMRNRFVVEIKISVLKMLNLRYLCTFKSGRNVQKAFGSEGRMS